jgi:membrane fusion protein (multidrug efflux system)
MDQRVDNERRTDSAPNAEGKSSGGAAAKKRSWREVFCERRVLVIAAAIGAVVLLLVLALWWLHARQYETTDDAFIDTRTVQISAQISAAIIDVPVTDNQLVEAGAELVRLDDRDFIAQVDQAKSAGRAIASGHCQSLGPDYGAGRAHRPGQ